MQHPGRQHMQQPQEHGQKQGAQPLHIEELPHHLSHPSRHAARYAQGLAQVVGREQKELILLMIGEQEGHSEPPEQVQSGQKQEAERRLSIS